MRSLVCAELLKLRTTRSAWIPIGVALVFAVLSVVATTSEAGLGGNPALSAAWLPELMRGSGGLFVDGAVLLAWIILSAGEFRHRTSVTTFLAEPRRQRVVSAKLAAAAFTGAVVGLVVEFVSAVTSAIVLSAHHVPVHWTSPGVRGALLAVPLLAALTRTPGLTRWLPGNAASAVLHATHHSATTLSAGAAAAVLTGYAIALTAAGATVTTRRDIGTATG